MNRSASLTLLQYVALIAGTMLANGVLPLPRAVAEDGGRAAWVVILVAGTIILGVALLADLVAGFFPSKDPAAWSLELLGPIAGRVWMAVYSLRSMAFVVLTARLYAAALNARVMLFTPGSVLAGLLTLLAVAIALTHMRGMARYAELVFFLTIPVLLLDFSPITQGYFFHLRPVLAGTELMDFMRALAPAAYSFAGFDILWFAYPYLKQQRESKKGVAIAVSLVTIAYAGLTITALMFFGLERLRVINFPTTALVGVTEVLFLERLDSLAFFLWISTVALTGGAHVYIVARLAEGMFPGVVFNKAAFALGGFLVVMSLGEQPARMILRAADIYGSLDFIFVAASVALLLILAYLRQRRRASGKD